MLHALSYDARSPVEVFEAVESTRIRNRLVGPVCIKERAGGPAACRAVARERMACAPACSRGSGRTSGARQRRRSGLLPIASPPAKS